MKKIIIILLLAPVFCAAQALLVKNYPLTYISCEDKSVEKIKAVLGPQGRIEADKENNSICVKDEPGYFNAVENLLKELDNPEVHPVKIKASLMLLEINRRDDDLEYSSFYRIKNSYYSGQYLVNPGLVETISSLSKSRASHITVLDRRDFVSEDGASIKEEGIDVKPQSYRNGQIGAGISYRWKDFDFEGKITADNGGVHWCAGAVEAIPEGGVKETILITALTVIDNAPPRCKETPWISVLRLAQKNNNDVLIDWSADLPFGGHGIQKYFIYRDEKPIVAKEKDKLIMADLSGDYTSFLDLAPKTPGKDYYYAVTAVNPSGMEQSLSKPVSITLSKTFVLGAEDKPGFITRRYICRYCRPGEVIRQVKGVLTKEGKAETNPLTNELIITDIEDVFEGFYQLMKELDNPMSNSSDINVSTLFFEMPAGSGICPDNETVRDFLSREKSGTSAYECVRTFTDIASFLAKNCGFSSPNYYSLFVNSEDGCETRVKMKDVVFVLTPQSQRDGTISFQYFLKNEDTETRTKTFGFQNQSKLIHKGLQDGSQKYYFLRGYGLSGVDSANSLPPCPATHPGSPELEITVVKDPVSGADNILLDWSKDMPWHAEGIYKYNIYRDSKLLVNNLKGNATSFLDASPEGPDGKHIYVVRAVNQFNVEQ